VRKFLARPQHEGVGAVVRRSIGRFELRYFDPFLVLDEFSVSAPAGFPDHPHRGFETVTYMLEVRSSSISAILVDLFFRFRQSKANLNEPPCVLCGGFTTKGIPSCLTH